MTASWCHCRHLQDWHLGEDNKGACRAGVCQCEEFTLGLPFAIGGVEPPPDRSWVSTEPSTKMPERKKHQRLKEFVTRWELPWYIGTAVLYFVALMLVPVIFPDMGSTALSLMILFAGFTASVGTMITALKQRWEK